MRNLPNFELTGKVFWDNCCMHATGRGNINTVLTLQNLGKVCSNAYFAEAQTCQSGTLHRSGTSNACLMKCHVTTGAVCLAHHLMFTTHWASFHLELFPHERWTVDLGIELLLYSPNCTIVCMLGIARKEHSASSTSWNTGRLINWLTSVGDMTLSRNQGFNRKVTTMSTQGMPKASDIDNIAYQHSWSMLRQ